MITDTEIIEVKRFLSFSLDKYGRKHSKPLNSVFLGDRGKGSR
jgi:hypothetical protein